MDFSLWVPKTATAHHWSNFRFPMSDVPRTHGARHDGPIHLLATAGTNDGLSYKVADSAVFEPTCPVQRCVRCQRCASRGGGDVCVGVCVCAGRGSLRSSSTDSDRPTEEQLQHALLWHADGLTIGRHRETSDCVAASRPPQSFFFSIRLTLFPWWRTLRRVALAVSPYISDSSSDQSKREGRITAPRSWTGTIPRTPHSFSRIWDFGERHNGISQCPCVEVRITPLQLLLLGERRDPHNYRASYYSRQLRQWQNSVGSGFEWVLHGNSAWAASHLHRKPYNPLSPMTFGVEVTYLSISYCDSDQLIEDVVCLFDAGGAGAHF